jgi:hypothetical protein
MAVAVVVAVTAVAAVVAGVTAERRHVAVFGC